MPDSGLSFTSDPDGALELAALPGQRDTDRSGELLDVAPAVGLGQDPGFRSVEGCRPQRGGLEPDHVVAALVGLCLSYGLVAPTDEAPDQHGVCLAEQGALDGTAQLDDRAGLAHG